MDEDGRITMLAFGGFVPDDSQEAVEAHLAQFPPLKPSFGPPGQKAKWANKAKQENEYRLNLLERLNQFLMALPAAMGNVKKCAKLANLNRTILDSTRIRVPEFARQWDAAIEGITDDLEEAGLKRAINGVQKDIYYQGMVAGTETVYSDSILTMMLAGRRNSVYKNSTSTELSGPNGGPVESVSKITRTVVDPVNHEQPAKPATK